MHSVFLPATEGIMVQELYKSKDPVCGPRGLRTPGSWVAGWGARGDMWCFGRGAVFLDLCTVLYRL